MNTTTRLLAMFGALALSAGGLQAAHQHTASCRSAGSCRYVPKIDRQLDTTRDLLENTQAALSVRQYDYAEVVQSINEVESRWAHLDRKRLELVYDLKKLATKATRLRNQLADLAHRRAELEQAIAACAVPRADLERAPRQIVRSAHDRRALKRDRGLRRKLGRVLREIEKTENRLYSVDLGSARVQEKCDALERRIAESQSAIDQLCRERHLIQREIAALSDDVAARVARLTALELELTQHRSWHPQPQKVVVVDRRCELERRLVRRTAPRLRRFERAPHFERASRFERGNRQGDLGRNGGPARRVASVRARR